MEMGFSFMKKIGSLLITGLLALTLSACGSSSENAPAASDGTGSSNEVVTYTIGTDATFPPFEYEQDGKYVGIDIDLIHAIGELEGFKVDLKPMNFKGIIPAITAKQLDAAIAGISITDERKQVVNLSDTYFEAGLSLVVHSDNDSITKPEDLKGKVIAIKKGTAGSKKAEELAKEYDITLNYFDSSPAMFQEVVNKNADATIEDFPVISYKLAVDPNANLKIVGERLTGDQYGIAVSKDNEELLQKINDGIKKLKESGKYDEIIKKYIGTSAK